MDAILSAVANALPDLIATHGLVLVFLLLSLAANVAQYRDNKTLNRQVTEEIKAGLNMANEYRETFAAGIEALDRRRTR